LQSRSQRRRAHHLSIQRSCQRRRPVYDAHSPTAVDVAAQGRRTIVPQASGDSPRTCIHASAASGASPPPSSRSAPPPPRRPCPRPRHARRRRALSHGPRHIPWLAIVPVASSSSCDRVTLVVGQRRRTRAGFWRKRRPDPRSARRAQASADRSRSHPLAFVGATRPVFQDRDRRVSSWARTSRWTHEGSVTFFHAGQWRRARAKAANTRALVSPVSEAEGWADFGCRAGGSSPRGHGRWQ